MSTLTTPSRTAWSRRGWAIYLGWAVITLDGSALNLALPSIAGQLHAEAGSISWVVDAYTLPLASLLLLGGSLGDRVGAERLFRVGAIGFAAASVACAVSPTIGLLIASRAAQGVFAALLLPMVLALAGKSFEDPVQRSTAVNMLTVFGGAGMAVGPFVGGLLTDTVGWRSVFWLTTPVAVAAVLLVGRADARRAPNRHVRFDVAGQVVGAAGLVALVGGLIEAGRGTSLALTAALLLAGVALLGLFVAVEKHSTSPMLPLTVFRAPGFAGAIAGGFAFQFSAYGLQFFLALYVQAAWGVSALTGGLLLVSFAIGTLLASLVVNPVMLRHDTRRMVLTGVALAATGTLALLGATDDHQWWLLFAADFLVGAGTAIYSTALNRTASTSLGAHDAGLASGIYNTSRQVGQSVGIAVLGAVAVMADPRAGYVVAILLVAGVVAAIAATQRRTTQGTSRTTRRLLHQS